MNIMSDAKISQQDLYLLYVDFSSAFNTIDHDKLLCIMLARGDKADRGDVCLLRCWGAEARGKWLCLSLGHMEVVLPQRLAMHKRRGEQIEEHASITNQLSTVPGVHWEMRGAICGLPCPGCCVYSLLSTRMLICCSCSSSRPGSRVSCPVSSSLLCRTCSSPKTALSGLYCFPGSFSCIHLVRHLPVEKGAVQAVYSVHLPWWVIRQFAC